MKKSFETFRRELADACTVAINQGVRIAPMGDARNDPQGKPLSPWDQDFDRLPL